VALLRHQPRARILWQSVVYCREEVAVKGDYQARVAVSLPCKAWTCPDCAVMRRSQLRGELKRGRPTHFLTITIRRQPGQTPDFAAQQLSRTWAIVRKRIDREARRDPERNPLPFGAAPEGGWQLPPHGSIPPRVRMSTKRLPFYAVFERHKSGWPHIHMLLRHEHVDIRWLRAQIVALIGSPQMKIVPIRSDGEAAVYITKYCTKNPHRFEGCKRYWQSQDYQVENWQPEPRFDNFPGSWVRDPHSLAIWADNWNSLGWTIERVDRHAAIARAPP